MDPFPWRFLVLFKPGELGVIFFKPGELGAIFFNTGELGAIFFKPGELGAILGGGGELSELELGCFRFLPGGWPFPCGWPRSGVQDLGLSNSSFFRSKPFNVGVPALLSGVFARLKGELTLTLLK